jgi:hypothetical protein
VTGKILYLQWWGGGTYPVQNMDPCKKLLPFAAGGDGQGEQLVRPGAKQGRPADSHYRERLA